MFIAALIAMSVIPLIRDSVGVLLMRTPKELDLELPACYTREQNHKTAAKMIEKIRVNVFLTTTCHNND
ncbi:hypothetical protein EB796_016890 [Bugula neritina]|uniref:Uncharacterized protein n=1 Tax=Bugula neritina TaxID=10212 RepID=A0A7J7JFH7_BUGNE|nr:hypothetical protein EB796_016890 [Bugula neritina]